MLDISPFTAAEATRFAKIRDDRHLLVHHGGTYTARYIKNKSIPERHRVFMDGIGITPARVQCDTQFLQNIARRIVHASHEALAKMIALEGASMPKETEYSLFMMRWWGNEKGGDEF